MNGILNGPEIKIKIIWLSNTSWGPHTRQNPMVIRGHLNKISQEKSFSLFWTLIPNSPGVSSYTFSKFVWVANPKFHEAGSLHSKLISVGRGFSSTVLFILKFVQIIIEREGLFRMKGRNVGAFEPRKTKPSEVLNLLRLDRCRTTQSNISPFSWASFRFRFRAKRECHTELPLRKPNLRNRSNTQCAHWLLPFQLHGCSIELSLEKGF